MPTVKRQRGGKGGRGERLLRHLRLLWPVWLRIKLVISFLTVNINNHKRPGSQSWLVERIVFGNCVSMDSYRKFMDSDCFGDHESGLLKIWFGDHEMIPDFKMFELNYYSWIQPIFKLFKWFYECGESSQILSAINKLNPYE